MRIISFISFLFFAFIAQEVLAQELDSTFRYSEMDVEKVIVERVARQQKMIDAFQNFPSPNFEAKDIKGEHHLLTDYEGHVLVLFFWNTFCQKCLDDLTVYNQIRKDYDEDIVTILSFVDDPTNEVEIFIERYYSDNELKYPIIPNAKKFAAEHFGRTNAYTPHIFIVDKYQTVRHVLSPDIRSSETWNAYQLIEPIINDLLKE